MWTSGSSPGSQWSLAGPLTHPPGAGLFPYPHKSRWENEMVEDDSGHVPYCCAARVPLNIQESLSHLAVGTDAQQCAFWPQAKEGWASLPVRSTPRHLWVPRGAEVPECWVVRKWGDDNPVKASLHPPESKCCQRERLRHCLEKTGRWPWTHFIPMAHGSPGPWEQSAMIVRTAHVSTLGCRRHPRQWGKCWGQNVLEPETGAWCACGTQARLDDLSRRSSSLMSWGYYKSWWGKVESSLKNM